MKKHIHAQPLESAAFAPFGDVIEALGNSNAANQGRAERFDAPLNLANTDPRVPRLHTAIYRIKQSTLPFELKLVERHPLSSQLFFPNSGARFLVCACANLADGEPDLTTLQAFIGARHQGIVWRKGTWHSPFAALDADGDFLMQQWQGGSAEDCEEHHFESPFLINGAMLSPPESRLP